MANEPEGGNSHRDLFLFQHLVLMFQTLALQQLGKIVSPITGKLERDLRQARITIDMLRMLQLKTAGNLAEDEKRLLDTAVLELQMNYVDESKRPAESGSDGRDESAAAQDAPPGQAQPDNGGSEEPETDGKDAGTRR